ncbi:Response regulator receiver domain-containing protein [Loktanella fryxellensis]|uniref:Response regulator receiver domain-containing protein n=2 Tax=Loktanella fryxellensis TaxID=245187 RepID=A0A1H8GNE3_9RHOB|nr:Response regulator receiver domain-containing protein [Loktanella fryxellensis]
MRILAVDDEPFIRELLPLFTARAGFRDVATADGGNTALQMIAAAEQPFDCFLLDVNMPGMDGITLCRRIRALPGHDRTPVIVLTAMNDRDDVARAFAVGATDYVTKPFDLVALGARLEAARDLRAAQLSSGAMAPCAPDIVQGRALDRVAFANYLAQLARGTTGQTQVFAIALAEIAVLQLPGHILGLTAATNRLTQAIDTALGGSGYFMTPTGPGTLVVATDASAALPVARIEALVQAALDAVRTAEATVMETPRLVIRTGRGVMPEASDQADIDAVIDRAAAQLDGPATPQRRWTAPFALFARRPAAPRAAQPSSARIAPQGLSRA